MVNSTSEISATTSSPSRMTADPQYRRPGIVFWYSIQASVCSNGSATPWSCASRCASCMVANSTLVNDVSNPVRLSRPSHGFGSP